MPIVRFENVTKQFDQDSYGIKEINFSVEPGEFIFLTGPSGSGKTTLMRLLLKEYPFNSGEIYFNETPLSGLKNRNVHLHRRRIGVVFQDYKLIPEMNVWENIALPLWVTGKAQEEVERRVTDLLNLIKLPEKALHFPSQLSGGEAQRIGIARALAIGPEVVIADEPTGNLDPETAQNVARLLKKINELGTTVIIATHDKNIISAYPDTRKIALEKGELIEDSHSGSKKKASVKPHTPSDTQTQEKSEGKPTSHGHDHHKEQHIAEDTIPEETPQKTEPNQPWWKKILGSKSTSKEKAADTKEVDKKPEHSAEDGEKAKPKDSDDDDLITITEEALDDDAEIETTHPKDKHEEKSEKKVTEKDHKKK